jgi:hypothetical protein
MPRGALGKSEENKPIKISKFSPQNSLKDIQSPRFFFPGTLGQLFVDTPDLVRLKMAWICFQALLCFSRHYQLQLGM